MTASGGLRLFVAAGAALALTLGSLPSVLACSCAPPPPPCEAIGKTELVFIGTVLAGSSDANPAVLRMSVDRIFKGGALGAEVELFDDGMCNGPGSTIGRQYLMYSHRMSSGKIAARGCTRTRAIENAAEDIEFLNRYLEGKTTTSISGVVRLQSDEPEGNRDVARPVEGSVTLAGLDKQYTRMTDSGGGYSLTGIAPGSYQIRYELPGYKAEWAPDSVMVSPKGCAVADAFLRVARRIHGTVRKEDGQPASGVSVELSPQHPEPESWRNPVLVAESDDRGRFEIDGIPPGTFLLGINISRAPTKRQPYPPTFYPNTRDRREAFPIPVPIGAFEQSFDLTVPASLPLVTFRGRIVDAGGAAATRRPQVRIKEPGLSGQIEDSPIEVDAEGRFQIEICEGVRYSAYAFAGFPGDVYSAPVEFVPGRERPELTLVLNKSAQQFLELSRQLQEDLK